MRVLLLFTLVIYSSAVYADFGFFTELPELENSQLIKEKIFKIYTPSDQYSSLSLENKATFLSGIESFLEQGLIDEVQYKALKFQLSYCESKKQDPCSLFIDIVRGTAFTAGKTGEVWTAFHNVDQAIVSKVGVFYKEVGKTDPSKMSDYLKTARIPVYLVNEDGQIIVEPKLDESNWATGFEFPVDNIQGVYTDEQPEADTDYVKMNFEQMSIKPLEISTKEVVSGEMLYVGGYPASTALDKSKYGALDSNGVDFYFAKGVVLDYQQFYLRQGYSDSMLMFLSPLEVARREQQLLTTIDAQFGHSGSPIFDKYLRVVGIFNEYFPTEDANPQNNSSIGAKFRDILH